MGGEGEVIHTQGQLAHTGAQKRAQGFNNTLKNYPGIKVVDETPGDWDRTKVATLWQDLLAALPGRQRRLLPQRRHGAGRRGHRRAGRQAGPGQARRHRRHAECLPSRSWTTSCSPQSSTRGPHPRRRDLGWLPDRSGTDKHEGGMPKFIRTDGGPITQDNAAGYIWLGRQLQSRDRAAGGAGAARRRRWSDISQDLADVSSPLADSARLPADLPEELSCAARRDQALRRRTCARRRRFRSPAGRDPWAGRRERRRQVHADEDPLRCSCAGRGRDRCCAGSRCASARQPTRRRAASA